MEPGAQRAGSRQRRNLTRADGLGHDASRMMPPTSKPLSHWCFCFSSPKWSLAPSCVLKAVVTPPTLAIPFRRLLWFGTTWVVGQIPISFPGESLCRQSSRNEKRVPRRSSRFPCSDPTPRESTSGLGRFTSPSRRIETLTPCVLPYLYLRSAGVGRLAQTVWCRYRRHGVHRRLLDSSVPNLGSARLRSLPGQCPPR